MRYRQRLFLLLTLWISIGLLPLSANQQVFQEQLEQAAVEVQKAMQLGPRKIDLSHFAELDLPEKYAYIPADEMKVLLKLLGNETNGVMGAIAPNPELASDSNWFVLLSYKDSGHIMDDDALDWDADELFSSIKSATEASNKIRRERGFPELNILDWVEKPHYDSRTNRLSWSIKTLGQNRSQAGINFNTLALSKEGYMSMNLVTQFEAIEKNKKISEELLELLTFKDGYKYSEFNSNTDRIAEYGLAALITGVAAKKIGLFAVIALFLAKFAKVIFIALAAGGGVFYSRRKKAKKEKEKEEEDNENS